VNLFGIDVKVIFLLRNDDILAYAWHYSNDKAMTHMERIKEFHGIEGEVKVDGDLERWLEERVREVVIDGKRFSLPDFGYRYREAYEEIARIPKGETRTYSEIARRAGIKYKDLLVALMRNPFQILIPCHRLVTKKGTLMGFYPLGKDVKRRLLEIEK